MAEQDLSIALKCRTSNKLRQVSAEVGGEVR